jgi:hypothetical protein
MRYWIARTVVMHNNYRFCVILSAFDDRGCLTNHSYSGGCLYDAISDVLAHVFL